MSTTGDTSSDYADYYDLGDFHRRVSTKNRLAQTWINRGIVWCYGFNHEEAAKCFERATAHDPSCAIAYWGLAYALGPNYNKPWDLFGTHERQTVAERAHRAVENAAAHAAHASPVEQALVRAIRSRYPADHAPGKSECSIWNAAYADAMAEVAAEFPDDLDVASLYCDALMNMTPWQLWDIRTGEPAAKARTLEAKRVLERALAQEGGMRHPGVLHLYVHLMEMSNTPEAALPAANCLRGLVPDAGHLNHMPSHIDVLVGDYTRGIVANTDAVRADEKFLAREGPMNFYTLYRSHDYHFRLYCAMFAANSKVAFETIRQLEASVPPELLLVEAPPMADWLEAFLAMRVHVLIRFGRWKDVLALEMPRDQDLYCTTTALIYYARGMALAATGRVGEAQKQRESFRLAVPRVKASRTLFNNKCKDILGVADAMLDGEISYRAGDYDAAFEHLRESIRRYDSLPFDEPWGWMQPVRHAYGALLLEQGRVQEALAVYSADLGLDESLPRVHRHPNNVWALHGYHECLLKLGRQQEAREIAPRLEAALALADVPIKSSCFCRTAVARM